LQRFPACVSRPDLLFACLPIVRWYATAVEPSTMKGSSDGQLCGSQDRFDPKDSKRVRAPAFSIAQFKGALRFGRVTRAK
jgi:hypothetical protein